MRSAGLHGVIRGKPMRTTVTDKTAPCPLDHVNRVFRAPAPNRLWLSGFVYVAFVIDAYARRIVGWRCLVRDYERRIDVSKAMILVAMGGNLPRRNAHP
jgi:transposase InsO family protein